MALPAEIPGSCNSQEECSPTIRSQKPAGSSVGVEMCECYAASSTAPFDECEGSQPCATAKCAGNACENYEAYCDFGALEAGLGELGECLLPAPKKAFSQKRPFWPPQGDFPHKPHKPWCPRHHLSGTHTPPTSTFIPPHPAETTERGP